MCSVGKYSKKRQGTDKAKQDKIHMCRNNHIWTPLYCTRLYTKQLSHQAMHNVSFDEFLSGFVVNYLHGVFIK